MPQEGDTMSTDGTTPGTAPTGEQGTEQAGQDPAAPKPTPPAQAPQQGSTDGGQDSTVTIARLEQELAAARKEAGKSRVTAKQQAADDARAELAQQIGRALGIVEDDTPPDPAALTQQLADEQQRARQTAVELAVYRTAREAGGDPDALLDSRAFAASIADLDPADADAVRAAVEAAVAANPKLATAAPSGPARSGAEFTGPGSAGVSAAQFAGMDYAARAELFQSDPDTYRRLASS